MALSNTLELIEFKIAPFSWNLWVSSHNTPPPMNLHLLKINYKTIFFPFSKHEFINNQVDGGNPLNPGNLGLTNFKWFHSTWYSVIQIYMKYFNSTWSFLNVVQLHVPALAILILILITRVACAYMIQCSIYIWSCYSKICYYMYTNFHKEEIFFACKFNRFRLITLIPLLFVCQAKIYIGVLVHKF